MMYLKKHKSSLILLSALVLLVISLFHPSIPLKRDLHHYLFIVDITQSMNTEDMYADDRFISRIAFTRRLLKSAVAKLSCGSKVSLGVFSAESVALLFTPIEVCSNYSVIQDTIAHIEWRMAWRGNSRLRFGVLSASAFQSSLPVPAQIVFFTDGDEAPKLNAVNKKDLSHWQGGKGWLIAGVGSNQTSPIPKLDSENEVLGYWAYANSIMAPSQVQSEESIGTRDSSIATAEYDRYLSKLDETYLKALSKEINASYIRATNPDDLIARMQTLKPAGQAVTQFPITWLCITAALCLVLSEYWPSLLSNFNKKPIFNSVTKD